MTFCYESLVNPNSAQDEPNHGEDGKDDGS